MRSKHTILRTRFRLHFQQVAAVLLLGTYLAGISPELAHAVIHDHSHGTLHTPATEKDPCHRSIYHHDKESGCDHEAHITSTEKCNCNIAFQPTQLTTSHAIVSQVSFQDHLDFSLYRFSLSKKACSGHTLRGPPTA